MPDLNLGPAPSSNPTRSIVAAAVILLLAAAGVFYWMSLQKSELTVTSGKPYAVHIETKAVKSEAPHVIGAPAHIENDLYLVLSVRLTNKLHEPMFIKDENATITSADQSVAQSDGLQKKDIDSVVGAFPDLKPLLGTPLLRDTKIDPGQTVEGTILVHYPNATEDFWSKRAGASVTLSFFHQQPITANLPK